MSEKLSGLALIKAKLADLNKQSQKPSTGGGTQNLYWKPGQRVDDKGNILPDLIRILPNKHSEDPEYPFLELPIYWPKQFGKTWLSPIYFGKNDPVVNYCNDLFDGSFIENKELYFQKNEIKKALMPGTRYYALVLDRNNEQDGPKWWNFGVEVFRELGELMTNEDYGMIHDLTTGRDLTIKYTPVEGKARAKTSVMPKPNVTVTTKDTEIQAKIENIGNVVDSFVCPSEKELDAALQKYLNVEPQKPAQSNNTNVRVNHDATNEGFDTTDFKVPSPRVEPDMSDLDDIFAELDSKLRKD
jgi:hypothetical protein